MHFNHKIKSIILSIFLHVAILGLFILPFYLHSSKCYKVSGNIKIARAYFVTSPQTSPHTKATKKHQDKQPVNIHTTVKDKAKINVTYTKKSLAHHTHAHQKKKHNQPAQSKAISGKTLDNLIQLIYKSIDKHKVFPAQALELHQQGKVIITFKLYPNGVIENVHLAHSSGFTSLDHAALKTLRATNPIKGVNTLLTTPQSFTIPISYHSH